MRHINWVREHAWLVTLLLLSPWAVTIGLREVADLRRAQGAAPPVVGSLWQEAPEGWEVSLLAIGVGGGLWLALYLRYGREYRERDLAEYVREPLPGWRPVEVGYLWRRGKLDLQDMTAMMLDLARRGALRIDVGRHAQGALRGMLAAAVGEPHYVTRLSEFAGVLTPSEQYLIAEILFHGAEDLPCVQIDGFKAYARAYPYLAQQRYREWRALAAAEWERPPVEEPAGRLAVGAGAAVGVALLVTVVFVGTVSTSLLGLAPAYIGLALIAASPLLRRRNREAACALRHWQAFRRYLTDFSELKHEPVPAVAMWGEYLVFAVTLGVAREVDHQLRGQYPQMVGE